MRILAKVFGGVPHHPHTMTFCLCAILLNNFHDTTGVELPAPFPVLFVRAADLCRACSRRATNAPSPAGAARQKVAPLVVDELGFAPFQRTAA